MTEKLYFHPNCRCVTNHKPFIDCTNYIIYHIKSLSKILIIYKN